MLIYLDVPYEEKGEAKQLGAKWDSSKRKWYYRGSVKEIYKFKKWTDAKSVFSDPNRIYFDVPMSDIDIVKDLGAKWDAEMKSWYHDGSPENYHIFSDWMNTEDTSSSTRSGLQQTIDNLKDELQTANNYISSLQTQIDELQQINKKLRVHSKQSAPNEQFPLFSGCNTKNDLHRRYKLLCKLLHPDNNQENLTKNFQDIQLQYNKLLSTYIN